jgi:hypothetical protein
MYNRNLGLSAEERHYIKKRRVFREFTKQRGVFGDERATKSLFYPVALNIGFNDTNNLNEFS